MAGQAVGISHFSDTLCVWAYVSQVRFDELAAQFEDRVAIEYRYCSVFGDVRGKLARGWAERGGARGYAEHVRGVAASFGHVSIHERTWAEVTPSSSMPAHLLLRAAALVDPGALPRLAWAVRTAFFAEARDISRRDVLLELAETHDVDRAAIERHLDHGTAHAALDQDARAAADQGIAVSPTAVFNQGRQRLTGNVGYRVLEANVAELLHGAADQASWC